MQILINLTEQTLALNGPLPRQFRISSSAKGVDHRQGSGGTPLGKHLVRARFGAGLPVAAVMAGRKFSGEYYSPALAEAHPDRDWILTRILWLGGLEPSRNLGGNVDTFQRFIYIHGTPDSDPMGEPTSWGCIRMRNEDIITLFDQVPVGTLVEIVE